MARVAKAGPASGKTTLVKVWNGLQPSRVAASISSSGMPKKNWRIMKMAKAAPIAPGTISG
ncbi:hypothetical protein D3C72_968010 [compost metagenome]